MIKHKLKPNDERIERTVLYYLMTNESVHYNSVMNIVDENCFYDPMYKSIFIQVKKLIDKNTSFTMTDVFNNVMTHTEYSQAKLIDVMNDADITNDAMFVNRATVLAEMSMRRKTIEQITPLVNGMYDKTNEAYESLEEIVNKAQDIFPESAEDVGRSEKFIGEALLRAKDLHDNPDTRMGITYGLRQLDNNLKGIKRRGELIIIGGSTGMGKTMLGVHMSVAAHQQGNKIMYASVEMDRNEIGYRMLSNLSNVPSTDIEFGNFDSEQFNSLVGRYQPMLEGNMIVMDRGGLTIESIVRRARKEHRTNGLDVIYVDYLQKLTSENPLYNRNKTDRSGYAAETLKDLSLELKVPVVALVQMNRQTAQNGSDNAQKKPQTHEIQHSSTIEQTANKVMMIHRPAYHTGDLTDTTAELIVSKNRNGQPFTANVNFYGATCKFTDISYNRMNEANNNDDIKRINNVTTQTMLDA